MTSFIVASASPVAPQATTPLIVYDNRSGATDISITSIKVTSTGATAVTIRLIGPITGTLTNTAALTFRSKAVSATAVSNASIANFFVYGATGGNTIGGTSGSDILDIESLALGDVTTTLGSGITIKAGTAVALFAAAGAADSLYILTTLQVR